MPDVIEQCLNTIPFIQHPSVSDYLETDRETRFVAQRLVRDFV
jgi:1-deoxy-D-xylulose-5-phosphate reductoisomerase